MNRTLRLFISFSLITLSLMSSMAVAKQQLSLWECHWVWTGEGDPRTAAPAGAIYLRSVVEIPNDEVVTGAKFLGTADDSFVLYVNGHEVGHGSDWGQLYLVDLSPYLNNTRNVFAISGTNRGHGPNPAGLIGKLEIILKSGRYIERSIDKSWKVSDKEIHGWLDEKFDDSSWQSVRELCAFGGTPWCVAGDISAIPEDFTHFVVPGQQRAMDSLRQMYFLHYPGTHPMSTMWDAWLPAPSLWPVVDVSPEVLDTLPKQWSQALSARKMEDDGYVYTHQHFSQAHEHGWTFPLWTQIAVSTSVPNFIWKPDGIAVGWHFQDNGPGWVWEHGYLQKNTKYTGTVAADSFALENLRSEEIKDNKWQLVATGESPMLTTPVGMEFDTFNAPFLQIRWTRTPVSGPDARCYVEWIGEGDAGFSPERRVFFSSLSVDGTDGVTGTQHCLIKMYTHPKWQGKIKRLRLSLAPGESNVSFAIDSLFTCYDTRQPINNPSFVLGSCEYINWTGDVSFIRANMPRLRKALRFCQTELGGLEHKVIKVPWVGHDGRPGSSINPDGTKTYHHGRGIGNNYLDILPFGNEDMYATSQYYAATLAMAELERAIAEHPEWEVPTEEEPFTADDLLKHAKNIKDTANKRFWNPKTGRFVACIDTDGVMWDYGYTSTNMEAIYYGIASDKHARAIMDWLSGKRIVEGDTSTGTDIYRWRFAPRTSTRRNIDWYPFHWAAPETTPWGLQNQDGGACLAWSFHDLTSRIRVLGPNDAWYRLREILNWFDEVQAESGYRAYYTGHPERGTLQGGGTSGGLGLDREFVESVMAPHALLEGFMGFRPRCDGFELRPRLPKDWPQLTITKIHYRQALLDITADNNSLVIRNSGRSEGPIRMYLHPGKWRVVASDDSATGASGKDVVVSGDNGCVTVSLKADSDLRLVRR